MTKVDSPCIRNCCLNNNDICIGCWRSLTEILQWQDSSDAQKSAILTLTETRHNAQLSAQNKWQALADLNAK
ncbi:DUF1289 domain-containing protein [Psychromonas antarctica]|jgi:predicted Fe-S protein YdhL (DUF1289 family)|uniref:DUF1289 domain-containing protein n=1 Tax=Psychromonas antarctica TaxID=67573 RepID=UPI001EE837A4|nr:DUF1289 domain-containing protein [Psychromonas antarctica]MCG6200064.1 DUF1289 domain-containing protein [Psychromonas antarctica]